MNFKAQPCIDITRCNIHYDITCSATKQQNISQTRDWQRYSVSCPNGRAMGCLLWALFLANLSRYNITALTQTLSCHFLLANYIAVAMLSKIRPGTTNTRQYIVMLSHMPLCISMIPGVCVQGMLNAQVKGQVTETYRLKVNSHCDTAFFISMYDITMVQPYRPLLQP